MIPIAKPFLGNEEIKAVEEVLKSGIIAQGPKVLEFEEKFSKFCGKKYAITVNSGTAALHTALHAIGAGEGDEIITTPLTFVATANSILMRGAKPVFADIKPDSFNIDPKCIRDKITDKTKAIITVDFYGQLCDYEEINKIAEENNLLVIEDACQAVNSDYNGKKAGSFGEIGCFSFYATKNITCGEGGVLVTDNKSFSEKARYFRQNGRSEMTSFEYAGLGYNYRMTDISAAMLLEQLKKIEHITQKRIENAEYLTEELKKIKGIQVPIVKDGHRHAFYLYTIRVKEEFKLSRDELADYLKKKGISSGIYYPKPLHLCGHFRKFGYKEGDFPVAELLSKQILSLPCHPSLKVDELNTIIDAFKSI